MTTPFLPSHKPDSHETGLRQRYSLKGIGTAICWVSGIALIPLGYSIVADFRQVGIVTDLINRPSLIYQSSFESNWISIEDNGLTAYGLAVLCGLAAFVLLVIWSWRSNKNIQMWEQQDGRDMRRGAGWAIGGWFIPFGNLFIPYQTIQDAWQRAPLSDTSWQKHHDRSRNNTWLICWLTWIAAISLSQIPRILSDDTPNGLRTNYFISGFSGILVAVSAITLIITVKQISDRHALSEGNEKTRMPEIIDASTSDSSFTTPPGITEPTPSDAQNASDEVEKKQRPLIKMNKPETEV